MDEQIRAKLYKTVEELSLRAVAPPSLIEQVFRFQPMSEMDTAESTTLSKYTVMLAQYLISLQVRFNEARVIAGQKKKVLDRKVAELLQLGAIEGKTLKEREANAIASSSELQELEREYDEAAAERDLLEGIDKPITELINAFKAENRRRENERYHMDRERI